MITAYDRTTVDGHVVNWRTREGLAVCLADIGFDTTVTKGSYLPPDDTSAATHSGGGAVDIRTRDLTEAQIRSLVKHLRLHFAAWYRQPPQFAEHVHAIMVGDQEMHDQARQQVAWYFQGLNGLWPNGGGTDDWPSASTAAAWREQTTTYPQTLQLGDDMDEQEYKEMRFYDLTSAQEGDTVAQKTITQNNYRRIRRTFEGVQTLLNSPPAVPITLTDEQLAKLSDMLADNLAKRLAD